MKDWILTGCGNKLPVYKHEFQDPRGRAIVRSKGKDVEPLDIILPMEYHMYTSRSGVLEKDAKTQYRFQPPEQAGGAHSGRDVAGLEARLHSPEKKRKKGIIEVSAGILKQMAEVHKQDPEVRGDPWQAERTDWWEKGSAADTTDHEEEDTLNDDEDEFVCGVTGEGVEENADCKQDGQGEEDTIATGIKSEASKLKERDPVRFEAELEEKANVINRRLDKFMRKKGGFHERRIRWARKGPKDEEQLTAAEHRRWEAHQIWKKAEKTQDEEVRVPKHLSRAVIMEVMGNVVQQVNTAETIGYLQRVQEAALTWNEDAVVAEQWKEAAKVFTHMLEWIKDNGKSEVDEDLVVQLTRMMLMWGSGAMSREGEDLKTLDVDAIKGVE